MWDGVIWVMALPPLWKVDRENTQPNIWQRIQFGINQYLHLKYSQDLKPERVVSNIIYTHDNFVITQRFMHHFIWQVAVKKSTQMFGSLMSFFRLFQSHFRFLRHRHSHPTKVTSDKIVFGNFYLFLRLSLSFFLSLTTFSSAHPFQLVSFLTSAYNPFLSLCLGIHHCLMLS